MRLDIITCLPRLLESPFNDSILKRAQEKGLVTVNVHDLRDYTTNKHRSTDDYAFGGGAGMVMTIEPGLYISPDTSRIPEGFNKDIPAKYLGIGVRIEDDVLITEDGNEVLSARVPKTIAEIEGTMAEARSQA
jgi:Xaa-Pro aminopeptidase